MSKFSFIICSWYSNYSKTVSKETLSLLLFFLVLISNVSAETYSFRQYNVDEGLAQSYVFTINQDKNGAIYFGTAAGLSKFNGKRIQNINNQEWHGRELHIFQSYG